MRKQTALEEQYNALSHGLGAVLGVIGLILLIIKVNSSVEWHLLSVVIYGLSVIVLFTASTLYHTIKNEQKKHVFRIVDHISIYLLIAGTYTPVLLITIPNSLGWMLFWVVWGIALFGTCLKLFFTGKFEVFSTLLYLVMGWLIVFDYTNVSNVLGSDGVFWLFSGGFFYTVGIVFYVLEKIPFSHVIWHVFVLCGAISHFIMIYCYVI